MDCGFLLGIALSAHIGLEGDYNKLHPHARVQCNDYIGGVYYNSDKKSSVYVGLEKELVDDLTIEYGIVNGYQSKNKIVPFGRIKYKNYFVTPAFEYGSKNTGVAIGVEFLLGD